MVLVWGTSMSEAVRTIASPAATWAIAVTATILTVFLATAAMFADRSVAREQRRERRLGLGPELGPAGTQWPRLTYTSMWPPMSEALLAAAGLPAGEAAEIRTGPPAADAAGRHDIPAQRGTPAERSVAAQYAAAAAAEEPPTVPIPAQRAQVMEAAQETQEVSAGQHSRRTDGTPGGDTPTMPDLPAQQAPEQAAARMPAQRAGESDRAERSFAGPAPQDDEEEP
jgi:hypothetical protein